jgi:hypothetical protein
LAAVIHEFVSTANANGIVPRIVFVPQNGESYRASQYFVRELNRDLNEPLAFEFLDDQMDWARYNLRGDGVCHPSPYGYGRLANFIVGTLGY